jgi:hypothetical protein
VIDAILAVVAVLMFPFAVLSTVVLWYAAHARPRVGALTERAFIGLDICVMLGSGSLLTVNRLMGHPLFPTAVATAVFSLSLIVLGAVPINWVRLWHRGELGERK